MNSQRMVLRSSSKLSSSIKSDKNPEPYHHQYFNQSILQTSKVSLCTFPFEVLEKILSYTDGKDILKISEVNKRLYSFIANSRCLMDKIKLKLMNRMDMNMQAILKSKRIYQNASVLFIGTLQKHIVDVLEKHSASIKILKWYWIQFKTEDLQKVLKKVPNVRIIEFHNVKYMCTQKITEKDCIHLPKLISMSCKYSNHKILQHFISCRVKEADLYNDGGSDEDGIENIECVSNFLASQNELESLVLRRYNIFLNDISERVSFKLKKLSCGLSMISDSSKMNFKKLLRKQSSTITNLDMKTDLDGEFLRIVLYEMEMLKTLKLFDATLTSIGAQNFTIQNNNITELVVSLDDEGEDDYQKILMLVNLLKLLPNLIEISLKSICVNFDLMVFMAYDLRNLERLSFLECRIDNFMALSNVKDVKFNFMATTQIVNFIRCNRQIENLTLGIGVKVLDEQLKVILDHLKELKFLDIVKISGVTENSLMIISEGKNLHTVKLNKQLFTRAKETCEIFMNKHNRIQILSK